MDLERTVADTMTNLLAVVALHLSAIGILGLILRAALGNVAKLITIAALFPCLVVDADKKLQDYLRNATIDRFTSIC